MLKLTAISPAHPQLQNQFKTDGSLMLNRISGLEIIQPENPVNPGERGDPAIMGQIIVSVLSSGAVVALVNVLGNFFARSKEISFEVVSSRGDRVSISSKNLSPNEIQTTVKLLESFVRPDLT